MNNNIDTEVKELIPPEKKEAYSRLASEFLSKDGEKNILIYIHALLGLIEGDTPEEAIIRSYLFDVALQVKNAGDNSKVLMEIFFSTQQPLILFHEWNKKNLIRNSIWENNARAISGVTTINAEQLNWIDLILADLNQFKLK